MYLHWVDSENSNNDYVLSADDQDLSSTWPVRYLFVENKVKNDPSQQWFITKDGNLYNRNSGSDYNVGNDKGAAVLSRGPKKQGQKTHVHKAKNSSTVTVC